jgi:hypothetical protein
LPPVSDWLCACLLVPVADDVLAPDELVLALLPVVAVPLPPAPPVALVLPTVADVFPTDDWLSLVFVLLDWFPVAVPPVALLWVLPPLIVPVVVLVAL